MYVYVEFVVKVQQFVILKMVVYDLLFINPEM
jgi:hypothetical protein